MQSEFIDRHIFIFLTAFSKTNKPLDLALGQYFRSHKSLGSKDRKIMGDTIYGMARWKSLLDHFSPNNPVSFYRNIDWERIAQNPSIPEHAKLGLSKFLYDELCLGFGVKEATRLGKILNESAPMTIRANLLKTTRDQLLKRFEKMFTISPCKKAPEGIQFKKREPLFSLPEFKEGLFEVQDEGSQLVAEMVQAKPGDLVLDYCSGSGGKSLAFAHQMQGSGQIYLHDIREKALLEARQRLKRAGIQNAQRLLPNHPQLKKLIGKCDWVLVDAPCTGTGTLRRNPDQKWKIDAAMLESLVQKQREIVGKALQYVKPGGTLVYVTCSLLPQENQTQIKYILETFPLKLEKEPLLLLPESGGMDGFFSASFRRH